MYTFVGGEFPLHRVSEYACVTANVSLGVT